MRRETVLELGLARREQHLGKPRRIEITAFRRRTLIAIGGEPINQPLRNDDSQGSEMIQSVVVEFGANEIRGACDLMELIEALLNGKKHGRTL